MQGDDTINLEPTSKIDITNYEFGNFYRISIMEVPGNFETEDFSVRDIDFIKNCSTFIYVIDNKIENLSEIEKQFNIYYKFINKHNTNYSFNILFHQTDCAFFNKVRESKQIKTFLETISELTNIHESGLNKNEKNEKKSTNKNKIVTYYTSIYDYSIFESMSRIISRLIKNKCPQIYEMINELYYVYL